MTESFVFKNFSRLSNLSILAYLILKALGQAYSTLVVIHGEIESIALDLQVIQKYEKLIFGAYYYLKAISNAQKEQKNSGRILRNFYMLP